MIKSKRYLWLFTLVASLLMVTGCKKEVQQVSIDSVWTNLYQTTPAKITSTYTGIYVTLKGSGFTGLKSILCNGVSVKFNPTFVTDNSIVFEIPTNVPMEDEVKIEEFKNTIRVITSQGQATYNDFIFKDKNRMPGISSVSNTMPKPGQIIYISGKNLERTSEVYFPGVGGEITATDFEIEPITNITTGEIGHRIKVTVPQGVGGVSGSIRVVAYGDEYYSPAYMFYDGGIFAKTLNEPGIKVSGSYSYTLYTDPTAIASATGLTLNPDNVIAIPATPMNFPVNTSAGTFANNSFFKFYLGAALRRVLDNQNSGITANTSLADLAFQFDLYIPNGWKSGTIALKLDKNSSPTSTNASVYYFTGWGANPYIFSNGWETVTIPFGSFTGLGLTDFGPFVSSIESLATKREALFGFLNYKFGSYGVAPITNFQMFIANIRIVPSSIPEAVN